jgi:hypothetical protein
MVTKVIRLTYDMASEGIHHPSRFSNSHLSSGVAFSATPCSPTTI